MNAAAFPSVKAYDEALHTVLTSTAVATVREANLPAERPAIDAIHSMSFEAVHRPILAEYLAANGRQDDVPQKWFDPSGECFVAEDKGQICGFVYVIAPPCDAYPDEHYPGGRHETRI